MSKTHWAILARILEIAGVVIFFTFFISLYVAGWRFESTRPHNPEPENGWTTPIGWTKGAYGTKADNRVMDDFSLGCLAGSSFSPPAEQLEFTS